VLSGHFDRAPFARWSCVRCLAVRRWHLPSRRGRQVEPEAVDDETQARFDAETEQRHDQLRSHLDLTGRANAAFAGAVGLDASKIPPELLRELEQAAERMSQHEPPPLPRE
jgi:hypothetical protein